jgi:hypothetical protein
MAAVSLVLWMLAAVRVPPPPGATYVRNLTLPFLGRQRVWLRVESAVHATVKMRGALDLDDTVGFSVDDDGELRAELSDSTRTLLRRVRTSIHALHYDDATDVATVTVQPPLPLPVTISLARDDGAAP